MKRFALLAVLLVVGCSAPLSRYGPADFGRTVVIGYGETELAPNRFEVFYLGWGRDTPQRVYDLALHRAAEVAVERGVERFAVEEVKRETVMVPVTGYQFNRPEVHLTVRLLVQGVGAGEGSEVFTAAEVLSRINP
jgi:hypothetical protein